MVRFAGYAKKKEPKWPYVMVTLAILLTVIAVIFIASAVTSWLESEINKPVTTTTTSSTTTTVASSTTSTTLAAARAATTTTNPAPQKTGKILSPAVVAAMASSTTGIKTDRIVIASSMNGNLPADDLSKLSASEFSKVYCYTSLTNAGAAQPIKHVWIAPSGRAAAEVELTARGGASATWSYINIAGMTVGQWAVEVRAGDGTMLARKVFETY
jgi:Protein of unknown function (DUF2914)